MINLHFDEFFNQLGLCFQKLNFNGVTVQEMVRCQVQTRSFGHQVDYHLDDPLLVKCVTGVLIALKVAKR